MGSALPGASAGVPVWGGAWAGPDASKGPAAGSSSAVMTRLIQESLAGNVPLNVHFDLTYRCNERCVHCYLDHEDYGELTTDEVTAVLDQLSEAGTLFLTFSGGEVFLRRDFFELLGYARRLHFDLSIKTNGLLVSSDRVARLKQLSVRHVQVSVYSANPVVHDAITRVPGSLARTLEGIRLVKAQGLKVKIACPLMRHNLTEYRSVQALAQELDVPYILDLTITPKLDGDRSLLALRNSPHDLLPILQDPKLNPRPEPRTDSENAESDCAASAFDELPCSAGHNSCYISPYGDVYPCVQMPLAAGNLRQQPFREIWFASPEMRKVRAIRESELPICSACTIRKHCQRCPGLAYMEDGDLRGPSERACELAELNARLAGVPNPVSAWHEHRDSKVAHSKSPRIAAQNSGDR